MRETFGAYEVIEGIAEGSMGLVYRVKSADGQEFALKTLRRQAYCEDDEENHLRFQREMQLSLKIDHPNIVKVYECQLNEDPPYMVMDFLAEGSLEDKLTKDGLVSPFEVLKVAKDMASALQHIERKGIVHRDIKPANILIDAGTYKLTDLGLARIMESSYEDGITLSQTALGTPDYVSPEQVMHARGVDVRSDIYSLGASLYHCLTGEKVHEGGSQLQLMMKHINEEVVPPIQVNPELPESLSVVLMKMLERNIEDRYQNPEAILDDLELITLDGDIVSDKTELVRPMNRIGMLMFSCFVLLVLFAGGVFVKMACLPPVEDDYFYMKQRTELRAAMKAPTREALEAKAKAIENFIVDYPRDKNLASMKRAADLAKKIAKGGRFQVLVESVGYFKQAEEFKVIWQLGEQRLEVESLGEKKAIFPNEKLNFIWQPGMKIRLQLEKQGWLDELVFDQELPKKISIMALSGKQTYVLTGEGAELFEDGELQITCKLKGISQEDWQTFKEYVYPGAHW